MKKLFFLAVTIFAFCSCNIDEEFTIENPKIILDNESGIYSTKVGHTITISPRYENTENAVFTWSINDSVIATTPTLQFCSNTLGEFYISIQVENEIGKEKREIRVDVVEVEIPIVSLANAEKGFILALNTEMKFTALVRETSLPTTYSWQLNGKVVSNSLAYNFLAKELGIYTLVFEAENEDGADQIETKIEVVEYAPASWYFEKTDYQLVAGRIIEVGPTETQNLENATFTFTLGENIVQEGKQQTWTCNLTQVGNHEVSITAKIAHGEKIEMLTQVINVNVISSSELNYRAKTENSNADWNKVFEYTPAPGQFINELKTGGFDGSQITPQAAVVYAENRLSAGNWVSLGGFGGYIVVGFDHSIDNTDNYDFAVVGNSFSGSSEPGIVWVMQDENGDGLPNDNWYELLGSDTESVSTIKNYAVTYYRPSGEQMSVQWTDNQGNLGKIDYLKTFHNQDFYYPNWIN
ncbi:MAG: cell surface protein, partial [Paludibacteraceae bacterium]|nr:cell surface protein [Paludibacteraceae bacterium]